MTAPGIFTAGYDPRPVYPKIIICNQKEVRQYEFTSEELDAGAARDFTLDPTWTLHKGVNGDPSLLEFFITDTDKSLVSSGTKKGSKIQRGWTVKFYLGQTSAGIRRVFYGWVQTADVIRDTNQYALHRIFCAHWVHRFENRSSKIKTFQKKASNGTDVDETDNEAKASEIFKRFCVRRELSVMKSIQGESQTDVPNMGAYWTFEDSLEDKLNDHDITPNPQFKDDTANEVDHLPGYTGTPAAIPTGQTEAMRYTGLRPNDEVSAVRLNITTPTGNIRVKVYDDNAGSPNNLLAQSGSVPAPGGGVQNIALQTRAKVPSDGIIWVAFEGDDARLKIRKTTGLRSGTTKTVQHPYGAGPHPFGSPGSQTYGWDMGYHLVPQILNELTYADGAVGKGAQGDGTVIYDVANYDEFNGDPAKFAASCAFKLNGPPASNAALMSHWNAPGGQKSWMMLIDSDGYLRIILSGDGIRNQKEYIYETDLCDGEIHYVGFDWNAGTLTIYVDGAAATVKKYLDIDVTSNQLHNSTAKITIMGNYWHTVPTNRTNALVDEVRIYDTNLTADQWDSIHHPPFDTQDVADIDIKLESFVSDHNSLADLANQISAATEALYGMDDDRKVFLRLPNQVDSGWMFTNETDGYDVESHDPTKMGLILGDGFQISDTIRESGKSLVTGVGTQESTLDINNTNENALIDLSQTWAAAPFTPTTNNLNKVAIKLKRFGKPEEDLVVLISSTVSETGQIARIVVSKENLRTIPDNDTAWLEIGFKKRLLEIGTTYHVRVERMGTQADHYEWAYDSAGGEFTDSSGVQTGNPTLRTYPTASLDLIMYNAAAARKFGIREATLNLRGLPSLETASEILFGIAPVIGGERRTYPPIKYRAQPIPPQLGCYCRVRDSYLTLARRAMIIGWDAQGQPEISGGCDTMTVHLEEYSV